MTTESNSKLRVRRVTVRGLFDVYDHVIDLNLDERITIIHGANGIGKTAILRMIHGLFQLRFSSLRSTPYAEFGIDFDDGSSIRVRKLASKEEGTGDLNIALQRTDGRILEDPITAPRGIADFAFPSRMIDELIPDLVRAGPETWRRLPSGEILTLEEVIENHSELLAPRYSGSRIDSESVARTTPEWLREFVQGLNVRFIETQRLVAPARPTIKSRYDSSGVLSPAVARYSSDLAALIQRTQAEYAAVSQRLDRSFPMRVVQRPGSVAVSVDQFKSRLASLEDKRKRLQAAGVLDRKADGDLSLPVPDDIDAETARVLAVYADDVEEKLNVFDSVVDSIELLRKFIEDHFAGKTLRIDKERGFTLVSTRTEQELNPSQLSSGEQHQLVLINELLFRTKPNTLFLIDEPELSLHVDWQLQFLEDLQSVIAISPFDVLLATHSPMIINERWDLTVSLEEHRC
ncbi:MAG: AAA family ATPase [Isosphaeraceae bacterium]|nr:AAA family ATPase [Isosphaeraceae bacterium]